MYSLYKFSIDFCSAHCLFLTGVSHSNCKSRADDAGMAVAFAAPVSGMVFIAEESAANLGPPVYYRALAANCVTLLVFNILAAAYNNGHEFWNAR